MIDTKQLLAKLGLPEGDDRNCLDSPLTFADGSHFGIELSSINNLRILQRAIGLAASAGIVINRVDECRGIFRLPEQEIREMVELCRENHISLVLSTGPRAFYDNGGFIKSKNGARMGFRLRGMDNLRYALEDITHAVELGARGFLIYDEGLLSLLNDLRTNGDLPGDVTFKLSVHCGCANPASARLYEQLGANSINLIPDLDIHMLSSIRQSVMCPLDVFSDTSSDAGGFIQTYKVPEIIRTCTPVYFKCGASSQVHQTHLPSDLELEERIKQLTCVLETIARFSPKAVQLNNKH